MNAGIKNNLCQNITGETKCESYFSGNGRDSFGDKADKHNGKDRDAESGIDLLHKGIKTVIRKNNQWRNKHSK